MLCSSPRTLDKKPQWPLISNLIPRLALPSSEPSIRKPSRRTHRLRTRPSRLHNPQPDINPQRPRRIPPPLVINPRVAPPRDIEHDSHKIPYELPTDTLGRAIVSDEAQLEAAPLDDEIGLRGREVGHPGRDAAGVDVGVEI